jgi:hypothetical protein
LIHEKDPHEDKTMVSSPPLHEVIQASIPPTHGEKSMVIYTHFQDLDDALFCDSESEDVLEEPSDGLNPSCYDNDDDVIDNIDEFIHVGICKWDVIYHDGYPIYDVEGCFQLLHLQQAYAVATNSYVWQHEDDVITYLS